MHASPRDDQYPRILNRHGAKVRARGREAEELIIGRHHDKPGEGDHEHGGRARERAEPPRLLGRSPFGRGVGPETESADGHGWQGLVAVMVHALPGVEELRRPGDGVEEHGDGDEGQGRHDSLALISSWLSSAGDLLLTGEERARYQGRGLDGGCRHVMLCV